MSLEIKFFYINLYDMKSEVTLPYWLGKNLMTLPGFLRPTPRSRNECSLMQFYHVTNHMNSYNKSGLLLSVLPCNLKNILIKIKGYFQKIAPSSKKKQTNKKLPTLQTI